MGKRQRIPLDGWTRRLGWEGKAMSVHCGVKGEVSRFGVCGDCTVMYLKQPHCKYLYSVVMYKKWTRLSIRFNGTESVMLWQVSTVIIFYA